ncbi:fimbrial assembly protein [Herminiimonas sp. KBW02]|uniref:CS1 type fimbrial major subunit n=1 Tax=Herminiimonas sp. KBW02 TaxID=2153363 RepID=UPI000F59526A|nr:CS1 type fimbrial major subunit [Herminiimonas sp. KBW02]RQO35005.1 fimbrial assembly protein [Herminiimonas sp. KBW02]
MKLHKLILAIAVGAASIGVASADSLNKSINLKATINDSIFVSKPDGSSWYGTEELEPDGFLQTKFTKVLPVRIYSTKNGFQVLLASPFQLANGGLTMTGTAKLAGVTLSSTAQKIKMVTPAGSGTPAGSFDQQYDLEIEAISPTVPEGVSRNGAYTGDLAMVFEATTITP